MTRKPASKGQLPGIQPTKRTEASSALRVALFAGVSVYLATILVILARQSSRVRLTATVSPSAGYCASTDAVPINAPHKNVWKNFNIDEATTIKKWLWAPDKNLNLTKERDATDL